MRIIWDDQDNRFLAELTPGEQWREDMEAAKAAGFRTTGPPAWQWYAGTVETLENIRKNPPKSGLTITEQALEKYKPLLEKFKQKQELRKQFKQAQKTAKKQSKDPGVSGLTELVIPEKGYIDASDLPPYVSKWVPPVFQIPDIFCIVCEAPLYLPFPDYSDICIWCEKIKLDRNLGS
jgi:hypothetical protein